MSGTPEPADTERGDVREEPMPRRQRSVLPSFLFISFVLFMITNNGGEEVSQRTHLLDLLDGIDHQIANYSAWLNGTAPENFTLVSTSRRVLCQCHRNVDDVC